MIVKHVWLFIIHLFNIVSDDTTNKTWAYSNNVFKTITPEVQIYNKCMLGQDKLVNKLGKCLRPGCTMLGLGVYIGAYRKVWCA